MRLFGKNIVVTGATGIAAAAAVHMAKHGAALYLISRDSEECERLALSRFREAGLPLPDLEVIFAATNTPCKGKYGLFQTAFTPWRLTICSELDSVYEHELAHGWLAATLTELKKDGFMKLRGYTVWSDQTVPWNERAMEGVAFTIQQGLSGLPLPPSLGVEQLSRLDAFELLTGFPDPRLIEWQAHPNRASVPASRQHNRPSSLA